MHPVTGDRKAVLKLMQDTLPQLGRGKPGGKSGGVRATSLGVAPKVATERDQIVERLSLGYQRQRDRDKLKTARLSLGDAGGEVDRWYAAREQGVALFQSAMDEFLDERQSPVPPPARRQAKGKSAKTKVANTTTNTKSVRAAGVRSGGSDAPAVSTLDPFYTRPAKMTGAHPAEVLEQFSTVDPRWVEVVWEKAKLLFKGKHKFIAHKSTTDFRFDMNQETRIAIVGDWGGGNAAAQAVARQIAHLAPDHVIHLGDVYYAGTPDEVQERFLKFWPRPSVPGLSFALNSNHEMYSGGYGYFDTTLRAFKQPASYFSLANRNWRIIGLDTGYIDHDLNPEQTAWLLAQFKGKFPKTILLSHHQLFSAYEDTDTSKLQQRVRPLLDQKQIYGWIWGHEHLCVKYQPYMGVKAICLGNGCFPYNPPNKEPKVPVEWMDVRKQAGDAQYQGTHTFALLTISGQQIKIEFINQNGDSAAPTIWA